MYIDCPTEPRMPSIKHLYTFGHMGFAALGCTTPNGLTRLSAIAARVSFARYNPNSWLDSGGALHAGEDLEPKNAGNALAVATNAICRSDVSRVIRMVTGHLAANVC
jgi:hypothetical protein